MTKKKYRFNPDTLNYERIGISIKEKFTKILAYFSSSLAFSLIIAVAALYFYESPKTKALKLFKFIIFINTKGLISEFL